MHTPLFEGAATALVTPFDENNNVNYGRLEEIIDFQINNNIDAIVICGTTGEPATLDEDEYYSVIEACIEHVRKRVPVIVGTGSNNTKTAIIHSKKAEELNADGILLITPYYNKTSQLGLIKHFEAVCGSVNLPAILYNVPSRTGMSVDLNTYKELALIPNLVGIKEASGDLGYVAKIIATCGDRFDIYSGCDDMIVPYMSLGAKGVISVASNIIPDKVFDMCEFCLDNNFKEAKKLQLTYLDLINALFCEVNPIPIKSAMRSIHMDCGSPRPPLWDLSFEKSAKLQKILWHHGLVQQK